MTELVLSIFPGIDLLGMAFEEHGACVVRGPDLITGGDIRQFHPPSEVFTGVIGGPPCQDFSALNRRPTGYSSDMLAEAIRVIEEARPDWFLLENVVRMPPFTIEGYEVQRFPLDLSWFTLSSRRRDFVFGSRNGGLIDPMMREGDRSEHSCVVSNDERSFSACCELHGLPRDFDIEGFSLQGKKRAIANSVPMQMGRYLASLILDRPAIPNREERRCACGCGRPVYGRARYSSAMCRKRAERARRNAARL